MQPQSQPLLWVGRTLGPGCWFDPTSITLPYIGLSNGNLTIARVAGGGSTPGGQIWNSQAKSSGLLYFEFDFNIGGGYANGAGIGISQIGNSYSNFLSGINGVVLLQNGNINGGGTSYALSFYNAPVVIGVAVNLTSRFMWFKNLTAAGPWNGSGAGNPATGLNGIALPSGPLIPMIVFGINLDTYTINLTGTTAAFAQPPPSGFSSWCP
jgi:hypothetical protein